MEASNDMIFRCSVTNQAPQPVDPQLYQYYNSTHKKYFNAHFFVRFTADFETLLDSTMIPPSHSSLFISCQEFFQHGSTILRRNLSHPLVPLEVLGTLTPLMLREAIKIFIYNRHPRIHNNAFAVFPLSLHMVVQLRDVEGAVMEYVTHQSMQQVRMVPASEEAIRSINKVKLEKEIVDTESCCICLKNFDEGVEISAMACQHIYHNDCIVQWLKTSHVCPLCRFPVSVASNS